MRMGVVLMLLLGDFADCPISARYTWHFRSFAGCVSWMGAAVVISELGIIRMRMGRMLRVLLGDVVDFWIGDRVMVHAWLELEGGMILVSARRLSERERAAHNESVLR